MTLRNGPCPCGSGRKFKKCHGVGNGPKAATAPGKVSMPVHFSIPQRDLFHRAQPAVLEGPKARWEAARMVIDFGSAILELNAPMRPERAIRDAVLVALLRRALVTSEGVRTLLSQGLEEPAMAITRTLLDIELAVKLVTMDHSDRMARRLAAWHYYGAQKHGQRMLKSPETRTGLEKGEGGKQRVIDVARSYAAFLESPVFDDVRKEVRASAMWHGYRNVEEAFSAAGAVSDYHVLYDISTSFVHVTNVDHDYADVRAKPDGGRDFRLKPLVQRDPEKLRASLGNMALRLHGIINMYLKDRELEPVLNAAVDRMLAASPQDSSVRASTRLDAIAGVAATVLEHFGDLGPEDDFQISSVS